MSSGGAVGTYLETRCPEARSLADAYEQALDAVGTDHLDVDVETDTGRAVSGARIGDALALLQRERGTKVTLTVQVQDAPSGMTGSARDLVRAVAARVGTTLMLGSNDTDATTTVADARAVVAGAQQAGYGFVGAWSLLRDNGGCAGTADEQDDCSGIDQGRWDFTHALQRFG